MFIPIFLPRDTQGIKCFVRNDGAEKDNQEKSESKSRKE